jgi:hypothetical protein
MRMMQVRNILDQVRDLHGQLAEYYGQLADAAARQRVRLLLDHMSSHEHHLQTSLATYEEGATQQVMNTYVNYIDCEEILTICEHSTITPEMSANEVIRVAMDIDNCLLRFYREVADRADTETVREVFRNLIDAEEAELRKLALDALAVADM